MRIYAVPKGWTWPEVLHFWRQSARVIWLLALPLLALAGCNAWRFKPQPIPMQAIEPTPGRVLTVPVIDLPPAMSPGARLLTPIESADEWTRIDLSMRCLAHCSGAIPPGCLGLCEMAAGCSPQQETPQQ